MAPTWRVENAVGSGHDRIAQGRDGPVIGLERFVARGDRAAHGDVAAVLLGPSPRELMACGEDCARVPVADPHRNRIARNDPTGIAERVVAARELDLDARNARGGSADRSAIPIIRRSDMLRIRAESAAEGGSRADGCSRSSDVTPGLRPESIAEHSTHSQSASDPDPST